MIIDSELNICPGFGWQGGPEFSTLVKEMQSGHERRRQRWEYAKHRFLLPFAAIEDGAYLTHIKSVFLACRGMAYAFWAKDFTDFRVEQMPFGVGDGVETDYPLTIRYTFGPAEYLRQVSRPINATVYVNGMPDSGVTWDAATRSIKFAAPPTGPLTWSGEHRVLVRFANDVLPMSIDNRFASGPYAMSGSVELIEVWQ